MTPRILVVDDEESIRFTFERFLKAEGYDVSTAKEYDEALREISWLEYDLVFTDIVLGEKTGIDILRAVREENPRCPVVMITGYPHVESAAESVRLGAFDYIPKPVLQDSLLAVTAKALRHKKMLDERENRYATIDAALRSFDGTIVAVDPELKVIEIKDSSRHCCSLSGGRKGEYIGSVVRGCEGRCIEFFQAVVGESARIESGHIECMHQEKQGGIASLIAYPLRNDRGETAGGVVIVRDVPHAGGRVSRHATGECHKMIGASTEMRRIFSLIDVLADTNTNVLITGESGTGKELVAEALHVQGNRASKPLVKVNCASLPENLIESELFGHVKGAFTGAIRDKMGRFQKADGGTIFLDEIGDVSLSVQTRLLRVLQETEFERVGDSNPVKVDVRVVVATNKDLRERVRKGEFREDLYYRLKVVDINLPPLRERNDDIPLLAGHFIKKLNAKLGRDIVSVSTDVMKILRAYDWPGNIRELEHVLEHAFIQCRLSTITVSDLPREVTEFVKTHTSLPGYDSAEARGAILDALQKTQWNKTKAAALLGISRRTIYRKIGEFSLSK
jgi:two-component system, NtrC family, response regulator HydG